MAYDAFISYSHTADGRLAPAVQSGLQRLARPWYRMRSLRVFRDETGLAVNPHLWASIETALDESEYFVLLASPEAAASPWVGREIEHWIATKPVERILPVVTDGDLVWDSAAGSYDLARSTALPPALATAFAVEPRHLDVRWARSETQLDLRHARFRAAIAGLAAPMHGVSRDELEGEDVQQHRRTMRIAAGAAALLLLVTIAAVVSASVAVSYASSARANERTALAERSRARHNAKEATTQRTLAVENASVAKSAQDTAESNANEAAANAAEAQVQRARAEQNADESAQNAAEAQANGNEAHDQSVAAQQNAARASANAARASANATTAEANAEAAAQSAGEARHAADIAAQQRQQAESSAAQARAQRARAVASATVARSRQLAASALNIFSTNPDRSLLMSVQGNQFQSNSEAQDSLMRTLQRQPLGLRAYIPNDAAVGTVGNVITSPDGRVLVTIGQGGRIGIRDLVAGTALRAPSAPVTGFGDFPGAAFSADGTWLVLQTSDSLVLWDVAAGRTVATLPKPFGLVEAAVISPDHRQLGVAADDGLHLLAIPAADGSSPSPSATTGPIALPAQFTPFRLAFSGDAGLLAVSGLSGSDLQAQVLVFDTGSGAQVATLPADTGGCQCLEQRGTAALTFAGQGGAQTLTSVAIHASDSTLISWQVGTWARVRTVPTPSALTATEQVVAVNADDTRIATSDGVDGLARIRDLVSGALVGPAFDAHLVFCSTCGDAFAQEGALAFGPSGTLVAAGSDSYVRWFDPSRNAPLSTPVAVSPDPSRLGSKTLSADGRVAAAVDVTAGQVVVLDATTGRVIRSLAAPVSDQSFVTLSPDGGTVVVGNDVAGPPGSTPSYVLSAWAVGTGQLLWQRPTDIVLLLGLIFDPSSQLVAAVGQPLSLSDELIELVDGATGGAVGAPTTIPFGFTQPAFSPDGAVITMGSLGPTFSTGAEGLVYGVAQHKVIRELHDPRLAGTAGIVISGDGRVAVAYPIGSGTISVLDGTTFAIRRQFLTSVAVSEVAISADGQRIVARSRDGTLQLFGTDFGEPIGDPIGPPASASPAPPTSGGLVYLGSTNTVVAFGGSGIVHVDADPASWARQACTAAGRNLTHQEWTDLLGHDVPYVATCPEFPTG